MDGPAFELPEPMPGDLELAAELAATPAPDLRELAERDPELADLLGALLADERAELVEILFDDDDDRGRELDELR